MRRVIIETHFLPSIEYFCALAGYDEIIVEKHEHFLKQSFRNRCYILTTNGIERLSVPVAIDSGKIQIAMVPIDYSNKWPINFWRTLQSAYAKAPYFEYYKDDLRSELFSGEMYLFDLNHRLLSLCLKWLGWKTTIGETTAYETKPDLTDLRNAISAKSNFASRSFYHPFSYQQVFGKQFVPNLGILDLLFCTGPDASGIIKSSIRKI